MSWMITGGTVMIRFLSLVLLLLVAGCGHPPEYEQTLSILNTEADRWDGGPEFETNAVDAYGHPLRVYIQKGPVVYSLELRSVGPDGLPKNNDDIVVYRTHPHGESTVTEEAAKSIGRISGESAKQATKGAVQGFKEGLRPGKKNEDAEEEEEKEPKGAEDEAEKDKENEETPEGC
jgi:hypothetical protein